MSRDERVDVLVVGAGPVGMLAALLLSKAGIRVRVVDSEWRISAHSYACALHPATLELFDEAGTAEDILDVGERVDTVAFYEGPKRRAEVRLSALPVTHPFLVVLPQSALEGILERRLNEFGTRIHWSHRLSDIRSEGETLVATIDRLEETAKGYVVPDFDWSVRKTVQARASFVLGADGYGSHVRRCLGIDYEQHGDPQSFFVYEFESDWRHGNEARVALDADTTSVLWPVSDTRYRWSFQFAPAEASSEFPSKERTSMSIVGPGVGEDTKREVLDLVRKRAPWFDGEISGVEWCTDVRFERRLAKRFGSGRCWLAGDAAHQTGPVGMHSMNAGLWESGELAVKLVKILRGTGSLDLLESYNQTRRGEWERMLQGEVRATERAGPWTQKYGARILPCIPALGEDLSRLANQLGLLWQ